MSKNLTYQKWTLGLIFALLVIRLGALFISPLGLHGDEAQYWAWSKELDWGYFTKPPLIAWTIWVTTSLFGDAEWAVRLSSPILHSLTALVIFRTGLLAFNAQTGFWAAAIYLLMPALWLSSGIVSTDVPLLLCWALALNAWLHLRRKASLRRALQLGAAIGFGLLAKYAMFFFFPALALVLIFDEKSRRGLGLRGSIAAGLTTFLIFLPNIIWNFNHDFATVSHTADNANLGQGGIPFHPLELGQFLLEQLVVFGPVTVFLLIAAFIYSLRYKLDEPALYLSFFAFSPLLIISTEALLSRANANWAVTAYVAGSILTAHLAVKYAPKFMGGFKGGVIIQSILCFMAGIVLLSPSLTDSIGLSNSVKRLRQWPATAVQIEEIYRRGHQGQEFQSLAVDRRIIFYDLTYYGLAQKLPLYMWKYGQSPVNHAELTAPLPTQAGPVLILNYHEHYEDELRADFQNLEKLPSLNIALGGGKFRKFNVWAGYGYTPTQER